VVAVSLRRVHTEWKVFAKDQAWANEVWVSLVLDADTGALHWRPRRRVWES